MHYQSIENLPSNYQLYQSVDIVILGYDGKDLSILLRKTDNYEDSGLLSLPGKLVHPDMDLDTAAENLFSHYVEPSNQSHLEQVHTFGDCGRHDQGRVITTAYYCLLWIEEEMVSNPDSDNVSWVSIENVEDLAYDHNRIVDYCLSKLRSTISSSTLGFKILPKYFTLSQVQQFYEVILQKEYDIRNFRKKLIQSGIIKKSTKTQNRVKHRPASLYYLKKESEVFDLV